MTNTPPLFVSIARRCSPISYHFRLLSSCLLFALALLPGKAAPTPAVKDPSSIFIVLVGDSTVTDAVGWGKAFPDWLVSGVICTNASKGGESSKSYYDDGRWAKALALHPTYVLIQFGHNDGPGKGPKRETIPNTTYREYLNRYVDEARAAGAIPILVTSLARRNFNKDGSLRDEVGPYVTAMKAVAADKKVPLVDLHARSYEVVKDLGPVASEDLGPILPNGKRDHTHLSPKGQVMMAKLVVDELRTAVPDLAPYLKPSLAQK